MLNSKRLISLCFVVGALSGAGCGTDHPDLKPGDQLGVDDLLGDPETDPGEQEGQGQLLGGIPTNDSGNGGGGTGGAGGAGGTGPGPALCGNGRIEAPELCDGVSMGTANCGQLGFTGGTLLCDPTTCTFDDSMCLSGAGGVGGAP